MKIKSVIVTLNLEYSLEITCSPKVLSFHLQYENISNIILFVKKKLNGRLRISLRTRTVYLWEVW